MTKTVIVTGISGSDIDTYLEQEREIFVKELLHELSEHGATPAEREQERIEECVRVYNVGSIMAEIASDMNLSYNFDHILQLDREKRNMLIHLASVEIERKINRQDKPEVALIKTHATMLDPGRQQFTRSVFASDWEHLSIDRVCCIINDEALVQKALQSDPQYRDVGLTYKDILNWTSLEIEKSEDLFEQLDLKQKWNDRMQVFSRHYSATSLYKFLMFDAPVIYAAYPMTAVEGNPEVEADVDKGIRLMQDYGIVKNPKAGDVGRSGLIHGHIDNADPDEVARGVHCVNRDLGYHVDKADIVFGNYPIDTHSDGMTTELWEAFQRTKFTILKVGEDTRSSASPFRTFAPSVIQRTYGGIETALQEEGYQPIFRDLMERHQQRCQAP